MTDFDQKKWFIKAATGKAHGPYSRDQLISLISKRLINENSLLRESSASSDWVRADQVLTLFHLQTDSIGSSCSQPSNKPPPLPSSTVTQESRSNLKQGREAGSQRRITAGENDASAFHRLPTVIGAASVFVLIALLGITILSVDSEYGRETALNRGVPLTSGSGFLVAPDLILTNRHVVLGSSIPSGARFLVSNDSSLSEGVWAYVQKVSDDPEVDLGLLKLEHPIRVQPIPVRREPPEEGEEFGLLGYPLAAHPGFEFQRHSNFGKVNSLHRDKKNFTHDATANPGNSGGPCVDMRGNNIGVLWGGFNDPDRGFPRAFAVSKVETRKFLENVVGYEPLTQRSVKLDAPEVVKLVGDAVFLITVYLP